MTQLVDLADEFELTTVAAVDLCAELGIPATTSDAELDDDEAARFRAAAPAWKAAHEVEEVRADDPLRLAPPMVSQTDFTQVPDSWRRAARQPPPPPPGSRGTERAAVVAAVAAGVSILVSAVVGLCGVLVALIPIGLSVKAKKAMEANATSGSGLVLTARIGSVVAMVVGVGVTWIAYTGEAHRLPAVALIDVFAPGELRAASSLEPGDCILDADVVPGSGELEIVQVVSCGDDHDIEYFARLETFGVSPVEELGEYPGADSLEQVMFTECTPLWEDYTGAAVGTGGLDLVIGYPTERAWAAGDRDLLCGVASIDGTPLRGTVSGSLR